MPSNWFVNGDKVRLCIVQRHAMCSDCKIHGCSKVGGGGGGPGVPANLPL